MMDLSKLADPTTRKALLLAEVAAWLHDIKKANFFENDFGEHLRPWVETRDVQSIHLEEDPLDRWLLAQSHGIGHIEKEEPDQNIGSQFISTPFGYEERNASPSEEERNNWLQAINADQTNRLLTRKLLGKMQADTRLPINEVSLWSWANVVAALYRSSLVNAIFHGKILSKPGLQQNLLQEARGKANALYQRNDIQQDNELQRKIVTIWGTLDPGRWNTSYKDLGQIVHQIQKFLAFDRMPENRLSQRHWNDLRSALDSLLEELQCVLELLVWHLLSVRTDGLGYLLSVSSIPDMLARKDLLEDGWDRVQKLLEETCPLGLEVYRDENGVVFVMPDIENVDTELIDQRPGKTLRQLILEAFSQGTTVNGNRPLHLDGEIIPAITVDPETWPGQKNLLPPMMDHLYPESPPVLQADPEAIADTWRRRQADICTVCGLRPQGPSRKAADRNVCDICERRRAARAKEWAKNLSTTVWVDEVADRHGRIALIVGAFDLQHWLSGDLVRSLAVREPNDQNGHEAEQVAKTPSFARLRRIWETTHRFWQEVAPPPKEEAFPLEKSLVAQVVGKTGPRLEIRGALRPPGDTPGPYHAYELVLPQGVKVSVLWDPQNKRFITLENLVYIVRLLDLEVSNTEEAAAKVTSFICGPLTIEEPAGYGAVNKVWGQITVQEVREMAGDYNPIISILAEPRTFMALLPADKAIEVSQKIKAKYECEMGKVRNRLPLHLGVVFAPRRAPLRTLLDAGRQMLQQTSETGGWEVKAMRKQPDDGGTLPPRFAPHQNGQFAKWREVILEQGSHQIIWHVPAVMGDGQIEDRWYPYVFLGMTAEPVACSRRFQALNPWTGQKDWLVHVSELQPGDRVYFTPSTFDFEFLDTTARRFEIHYDEHGRRTTRRTRPFYLEDLDRLDTLWNYMKRLAKTQRHQVVRTIEAAREMWYGQDSDNASTTDEVFKQFVADTLAGATWPKEQPWSSIPQEWQAELIQAGARGELADLAELHMEILKE